MPVASPPRTALSRAASDASDDGESRFGQGGAAGPHFPSLAPDPAAPRPRPRPGPAAAVDLATIADLGDMVTIHYTLADEGGAVLDSSRARGDPLTFEVGAGDVFGNPIYQAFDGVVRGLALGERSTLRAEGDPWTPDLCWRVPGDHPEVERLAGRSKNVGGLAPGLVVELANGARAVVVAVDAGTGDVTIDANDMLAGRARIFELELVGLTKKAGAGAAAEA